MTRGRVRICPFCGTEGMVLAMGGIGGAVYKCSNCQYTGPIVLEGEFETESGKEPRASYVGFARLNSTLNWTGLLFGLAFMGIGLFVVFWPLSVGQSSLLGRQFFADSGSKLLGIGVVLVIVSGLFWLGERSRNVDKPF